MIWISRSGLRGGIGAAAHRQRVHYVNAIGQCQGHSSAVSALDQNVARSDSADPNGVLQVWQWFSGDLPARGVLPGDDLK
ncbi:hypothetical protein [Cupriavidus agavae]|uniref:hypothetical protein n=1 Tax=Cupriavidus agavae TaxID=1001822 RepID=UPI00102B164F|nr:hypothetical protein [Cupriavidus agavae]